MAVTQADLESRLASAVPARNGIPGSAQYTQAVNAAVADLSRRSPMKKVVTLAVVSGTATYALPADFLRVIRLETLTGADGVLVSDAGLLPVSSAFKECYTVTGTEITFYPTPRYTASRDLWYAAAYVPDSNGVYQDMTEAVAAAALLNAQSRCLMLQANKAAQEAWQYAVGDEKVSKEKLSDALWKQARAVDEQYLAAVAQLIGVAAIRGDYMRSSL